MASTVGLTHPARGAFVWHDYFAVPLSFALLPSSTPPRVTNCAASTVRITPEMFSVAAPAAPLALSQTMRSCRSPLTITQVRLAARRDRLVDLADALRLGLGNRRDAHRLRLRLGLRVDLHALGVRRGLGDLRGA